MFDAHNTPKLTPPLFKYKNFIYGRIFLPQLAAKKDELLIRKQRNIRISGEVEATRRDIKTLNAELKALQHLVDRMGRQLAAFKAEQAKFENEAKTVEGETAMQLAQKENKHQEILAALKVRRLSKSV